MESKRRMPLLAAFVVAFGLMGGAMAQAEGPVPADPDPVICALTGGGEACSEEPGQPSEPGQPGEPSEPGQPGEPSEPSPGEPSEPSPGEPSEPSPGQPSEPGYGGGGGGTQPS